jgi:hypothetical protein
MLFTSKPLEVADSKLFHADNIPSIALVMCRNGADIMSFNRIAVPIVAIFIHLPFLLDLVCFFLFRFNSQINSGNQEGFIRLIKIQKL